MRSLPTGLKANRFNGAPSAAGQRELIIGERQTGKTAVAVTESSISAQGRICIYVAIGGRLQTRRAGGKDSAGLWRDGLHDCGQATASDPPPCSFSRYSGAAMGRSTSAIAATRSDHL